MILYCIFVGCEDVYCGGDNICGLLAALPDLLHLHLPQQGHRQEALHPARLPGLLLARHGQLYVQPLRLLLDECQVRLFFFRQ